ncbi:apolipo protein O-domain-containing protein [Coprinopsis sp. MPI-PUGE-AT-0042]|nr:apolipo protein O-domain-containing protein [Coprinopsis sp. MPI-PUGE-AT-0042]
MFRAASSSIPRRAAFAAATAGGVVFVEKPREKLSIYSASETPVTLVEAPSPLTDQIAVYRRHVQRTYADSHSYVQGWVSKWIEVEQAIENRVKSIISPREQLTPGLLYVGVATLTGSVLGRNRFILTRLALPPIFLVLSARHFLPETTANLSNYLGSVEEHYFPELARKHDIAKAHTQMSIDMAKDWTRDVRDQIRVGALRSVDKVQDTTGLKIKETLGLGLEKAEGKSLELFRRAEEKAIEIAKKADAAIDHALVKAEAKAEQLVVEVEKKAEELVEKVEKKEEVQPEQDVAVVEVEAPVTKEDEPPKRLV